MRFQKAKLYKNSEAKDNYNRRSIGTEYVKDISLFFKLLSQNNTEDARYRDATHFGLTPEKNISTLNSVEFNGTKYKVLLASPTKRINQLWLKEML